MGTSYLLDSNIVIYLSKGILTTENSSVIASIATEPLSISVITKIEVLGWNAPTAEEAQVLQQFMDNATIYPLSEAVVSTTINLRKTHAIKLPDAIIAATALVHDFTLLTRNVTDFSKLSELTVVNPMG